MTGCGRSGVGKAIASALIAALGFAFSTAASEAAGNSFDISIQAGYHNAYKLGEWMPVTIDVTNRGQQVEATLEVDAAASSGNKGGPPGGTAIYQTPLSLAPGATKHIRTYVSEDAAGNVDARIVQGGRVLQSAQVSIATTVSDLLVGVLSDNATALDAIATIHPGGVAPTVVHLQATDLSDSALVLRAFDLIAFDDFSSDTLTVGQRAALADYVMNGGSLLLSTGGSWHKTLAGLPAAVVPM